MSFKIQSSMKWVESEKIGFSKSFGYISLKSCSKSLKYITEFQFAVFICLKKAHIFSSIFTNLTLRSMKARVEELAPVVYENLIKLTTLIIISTLKLKTLSMLTIERSYIDRQTVRQTQREMNRQTLGEMNKHTLYTTKHH